MNWQPEITVAAVIERAQRFLIVEERIKNRVVLNQPAGHVEQGESLLAAVARETLEESAWQFTPEWLTGIYLWRHPRAGRDTLRFTFSGSIAAHDPTRALDHPVIATHWLRREELLHPARPLRTPIVLRCIDDYLAGRRLPLTAINDPPV